MGANAVMPPDRYSNRPERDRCNNENGFSGTSGSTRGRIAKVVPGDAYRVDSQPFTRVARPHAPTMPSPSEILRATHRQQTGFYVFALPS